MNRTSKTAAFAGHRTFRGRTAELADPCNAVSITSLVEDALRDFCICEQSGAVFTIVRGSCGADCPAGGDPCDVNCDGAIHRFDIRNFVSRLSAYEQSGTDSRRSA